VFKLQSVQMFLARKQRKKIVKQMEKVKSDVLPIVNFIPPVAESLDYIIKYWALREKGFIFFGIKIDRKLLYTVMGLLTSVFIAVFNKIIVSFMAEQQPLS